MANDSTSPKQSSPMSRTLGQRGPNGLVRAGAVLQHLLSEGGRPQYDGLPALTISSFDGSTERITILPGTSLDMRWDSADGATYMLSMTGWRCAHCRETMTLAEARLESFLIMPCGSGGIPGTVAHNWYPMIRIVEQGSI